MGLISKFTGSGFSVVYRSILLLFLAEIGFHWIRLNRGLPFGFTPKSHAWHHEVIAQTGFEAKFGKRWYLLISTVFLPNVRGRLIVWASVAAWTVSTGHSYVDV